MQLKIAGGCGEHGRNCFWVGMGGLSFLVDCGIMAGSDSPFPNLTANEILSLKYVFLTHSHSDHTGAIPWLYENGFSGRIIASVHTLEQLPFEVKKADALEDIFGGKCGVIDGIELEYGRSGHCVGSVWYRFCNGGRTVLFSGDYYENSPVYYCDKIRDKSADIAVLDCAYGKQLRSFSDYCDDIISETEKLKMFGNKVIFPVPKYGRGIDLLKLFCERTPRLVCSGDEHFIRKLNEISGKRNWYKDFFVSAKLYSPDEACDILFLSDPQLRSEKSRDTAKEVISQGGYAIMTGTVEHGSFSEQLINEGKMKQLRYPVHQNFSEYTLLINKNKFRRVIPYHTAEYTSAHRF